jgi:hypothetical protein
MVQPPWVHLKQLLWYGVPLTVTFKEVNIINMPSIFNYIFTLTKRPSWFWLKQNDRPETLKTIKGAELHISVNSLITKAAISLNNA